MRFYAFSMHKNAFWAENKLVKKIEKFAKLKIVDRHLAVYEYLLSSERSTVYDLDLAANP